jgi:cytochrome c6
VKKNLFSLALSLFVSLGIVLGWHQAQALADISEGAKIFISNCAACHAGGLNRVVAPKNLKLATLEKYHMNSVEAIVTQITRGKGAMPAFQKKLKPEEINIVANYVLEQAEKGWAKE